MEDDGEHGAPVPAGGGDEALARSPGVARLHAYGPRVRLEQLVVVAQLVVGAVGAVEAVEGVGHGLGDHRVGQPCSCRDGQVAGYPGLSRLKWDAPMQPCHGKQLSP